MCNSRKELPYDTGMRLLLAEDDPYASIATLAWPANVLLAGVLAKDGDLLLDG